MMVITDTIGEFFNLVLRTLVSLFTPPLRVRDVVKETYFVANESVLIIAICVSFAAVVTIIEASFHMKLIIQNDSMVPGFASVLILRELGAVITGLLLTSRVGAGMAAEVATMQVTEQVDALRMLGIDPVRFLVVPRLVACVLGGLLLTIIANILCLWCAMMVCQFKLGYSPATFLAGMRVFVHFRDLWFAAIKGMCFGAVIPMMSCFFGFRARAGAEGVGKATTSAVVASSVLIIFLDFALGLIFSQYY